MTDIRAVSIKIPPAKHVCSVQILHGKHVFISYTHPTQQYDLDQTDHTGPTTQHDLDREDHMDQGYICPQGPDHLDHDLICAVCGKFRFRRTNTLHLISVL